MFTFDASSIDKSLPVPVGTQLYGLLSYFLSFADLPRGTKLQSVRQLAAEIGVAPMTVSQVYQQLRDEGLIEIRSGLGAFVARDPNAPSEEVQPLSLLSKDIDAILAKADAVGVTPMSLVSMISARAHMRSTESGLKLVFVAIFEEVGRDYVAQIRPALSSVDEITLVTLDDIRFDEEARKLCFDADLVLTFGNRESEVRGTLKGLDVFGLKFIPSQKTRQTLAGLDSRTRVAAVSRFKEYIAVMRPSVREFAPHVADVVVTYTDAPDLKAVIQSCDAVVYASGADEVAELARKGVPCFEFRHAPDPVALDTVLAPRLALLRQGRATR
jgi:DNA-binding transcriptional regulator YhcF (GntR family)